MPTTTRHADRAFSATARHAERVFAAIEAAADEMVDFTAEMIRIPTVNPPGEAYEDCARLIGDRLGQYGFEVEYLAAEGSPQHTAAYPRINVVGLRRGRSLRPLVHLNGHFDVVPAQSREQFRPLRANAAHHRGQLRAIVAIETEIRQAEIEPLGHAQRLRSLGRLARAQFRRAARAGLAARQVRQHHAMAM